MALFVPRVLLAPARVVLRTLFVPLRAGFGWLNRWVAFDGSSATDERTLRHVAVRPHLSFLSGYGPTAGATIDYGDLDGHGEHALARAEVGGRYQLAGELAFDAARVGGSRLWIQTAARYERLPQEVFQGIGDAQATAAFVPARYAEERATAFARVGATFGRPEGLVQIGLTSLLTRRRFGPRGAVWGGSSDDPSIEVVDDPRALAGFVSGTQTLEESVHLRIDTTPATGTPTRGVRVELFAGGVPPLDVNRHAYAHLGVDATGYLNLYRQTRILVLRGAIEAVEGDPDRIPFSDLPALGGPARLRGYRIDRFRDRKSLLASVEYEYPIHSNISGALFVEAGHVAPDYGELFTRLRGFRAGAGAGLRLRIGGAVLFRLDFAYGDGPSLFLTTSPLASLLPRARVP